MKNKLNFNFDFLNTENSSSNKSFIQDEKNNNPDSSTSNNEDDKQHAIRKIFAKLDLAESEIEKMTPYKADMLIRDIEYYINSLNNKGLNRHIISELLIITEKLSKCKKTIQAIKLLKFAESINKDEDLKILIKNQLATNYTSESNKKTESYNYPQKSNKIVPAIIIIVFIILSIYVGYIIYQDNKNTEIAKLKKSAYSYVINKDKEKLQNDLRQLKKYGVDTKELMNEFKNRYNQEKQNIISEIAHSYENDTEKFKSLKKQYLPIYFDNNENIFNEEIEKKLGYKELSLKPETLPSSGILHNYSGRKLIAPFEIKTQSNDENYYIKLVNVNSGKDDIIIFLRGGESKKMEVPIGTYKIKEATGTNWYGEKLLFGHNTRYTTSDELLTFKISGSYVEGHTLTLYKVLNGNFETRNLNAEDF